MILDFGKHKGKEIEDVPLTYVIFLAGYSMRWAKRVRADLAGCKWVQAYRKDVVNAAQSYLEDKCWHCGGKLVPVGSARMNGAAHDDWDGRYLHKRCWRELKDEENHARTSDSQHFEHPS